MASPHFELKAIKRAYKPGNGPSSLVAKAAYISGSALHDERRDRVSDFSRRRGVAFEAILAPGNAPSWAYDRSKLWNRAEAAEKRHDSVLGHELVIALPKELDLQQNLKLLTDYLERHFVSQGIVCDLAIHEGGGFRGNVHAHVMLTRRFLRDGEFQEIDDRRDAHRGRRSAKGNGKFVELLRGDWARSQNLVFQRLGLETRVDLRSFARQGRGLVPMSPEDPRNRPHQKDIDRVGGLNVAADLLDARADQFLASPELAIDLATERIGLFTRAGLRAFLAQHVPSARIEEVYSSLMRQRALHRVGRADDGEALYAGAKWVARQKLGRLYARKPERALSDFLAARSKAVFTRADLEEWLLHAITSEHFDAAMRAIFRSRALILLGGDKAGDLHYTSRPYLAAERSLLKDARSLALGQQLAVRAALVDDVSRRHALYLEQELAYRYLVEYSSDLAIVEGLAGTGKSYLLGAAREAWERAGYRVKGAALSGKATKGLSEQSGIASRTLASWEYGWMMGVHRLGRRDVFVVDEAGMIGTAQMARLVERVRKSGAKLVVVGDRRQLQPLDAGQPFALLGEQFGSVSLTNVMRQRVPWMRMASRLMGLGDVSTGLHAYREQGCVVENSTVEAMIRRWATLRDTTAVDDMLMLAYSNASVCTANDLAQAERLRRGELGELAIPFEYRWTDRDGNEQIHPFLIRSGDRFLAMQTDRGLGLDNGALGTVMDVSATSLTVRLDTGVVTTFDPRVYTRFALGYCATVHRAQGATVDRVLVLGSPAFDAHATYVAMTRHRRSVELHLPKHLELEALCKEAPAYSAVNFAIPEVRDRPAYELGSLRGGEPGEAVRAKYRTLDDDQLSARVNALYSDAERLRPRPEDYLRPSHAAMEAQRALEGNAYAPDGKPLPSVPPKERARLLRMAGSPWSRLKEWKQARLRSQVAAERVAKVRSELAFAREVQRERQILRAEQQMLDELRANKPQWRRTAVRVAELHAQQSGGHAPRLSEAARRALAIPERVAAVERWLAFAIERPAEALSIRQQADGDEYLRMMEQLPNARRERRSPKQDLGSGVARWHRRLDEIESRLAQVVMERLNSARLSSEDERRFLGMEAKLDQDVFRARNRLERSLGMTPQRVHGDPGGADLSALESARNAQATVFAKSASEWERAKLSLTEQEVHRVRAGAEDAPERALRLYKHYRDSHAEYRDLKKAFARALKLARARQV